MNLEHIFEKMEIDADPFALCELRGACHMALGRQPAATLHYLLAGEGELSISGSPAVPLRPGTLVLVPALRSHVLRGFGGPGNPVPDCHPAEFKLSHHLAEAEGASGGCLLALCSHLTVGLRGARDLVDLIREPLVETVEPGSAVEDLLARLVNELSLPRLGSRALVRTLLLEGMIHLLRTRIVAEDPAMDWMSVLQDEKIWAALEAMLENPGGAHSVESLAAVAGLSRSTFAMRFADAYGSGPMELLRSLRMRMAAALLSDSSLPVKRIAELTGFQSRSAFTRAFEAATGTSPRSFRAK